MNNGMDFSPEVIAEIEANRKVTAIKLLRAQRSIGLKEAKLAVDAYIDQHPYDPAHHSKQPASGIGRLVFIALVAGLAYGLYQFFA